MRSFSAVSLGVLGLFSLLSYKAEGPPYPPFLSAHLRNVEGMPFQWRCFTPADVQYQCLPMEPEESGNVRSDLVLTIRAPKRSHTYSIRHAIDLDYCRQITADWLELMKGEDVVCLLGDSTDRLRNVHPHEYRSWIWDKLVTARGCSSWFGRWCEPG